MSKILGNAVLGQKKAPAGCPDSKTKVVNIFQHIPDPNYIEKSMFLHRIHRKLSIFNEFDMKTEIF